MVARGLVVYKKWLLADQLEATSGYLRADDICLLVGSWCVMDGCRWVSLV